MTTLYRPLRLVLTLTIIGTLSACQSLQHAYQTKIAKRQSTTRTPISTPTTITPVVPTATSPQTPNHTATQTTTTPTQPSQIIPPSFSITGKIGVTTLDADGNRQAGSAFYAWGQEKERFAIDLTGALGLGATSIQYDGKTALLISEKTGEIRADNPEALLLKSTGWHAPISHLPFWVMGKNAPNDTNSQHDGDKLSSATNGQWQAHFDYNRQALPHRIRLTHQDGHRVVLSINGR